MLGCELIKVEGAPYYQSLLNGIYMRTARTGNEDGHSPIFAKDFHRRNGSARYLYWTDEYGGAWLLDDDMDPSSSNGFLSSPGSRMAGTWELANRSKHWIKERMVSLSCFKDQEKEATVMEDRDDCSDNNGLVVKDHHVTPHVNEATKKAVPEIVISRIKEGTNVVIIIRVQTDTSVDDCNDIDVSISAARSLERTRLKTVPIDTRITLGAEI
mmetsp:Transcript_10138/g.13972  ORF Transcript_10138/g.13972 Transcript_10138/m.13972 type:complete len:213 (+) Transcript_10138:503-1141(+)